MVDIVILWVNTEDSSWIEDYKKYSKKEGRHANESTRYRDYGTLRYILRGIEKNARWFNKVHIILAQQSQLPCWINTNSERLEIHYHKEFIPINLLPTFNSNVIEMYLHNIKSLSENYVLFNDDQFILNSIPENYFVEDNKPVFCVKEVDLRFKLSQFNTFHQSMDNNLMFSVNYCSDNNLKIRKFKHNHLPEVHVKSFENNVVSKNRDLFLMSFIKSRFRSSTNFTNWLFSDLLKIEGACVNKDIYKNSKYATLCEDISDISKYEMVCINDDLNCNFSEKMDELRGILDSVYPNKSSFEK